MGAEEAGGTLLRPAQKLGAVIRAIEVQGAVA